MPAKIPLSHELDICKRYTAGETSGVLAKDFGVTISCVAAVLKRNGITPVNRKPTRFKSPKGDALPKEVIVERYISGESENSIAKSFFVARNVIRRIIADAGIAPRNSIIANRLMMATRSKADHIKNTIAAHNAIRGVPQPEERQRKKALTIQGRWEQFASEGERHLIAILREKGVEVTPQKACGRYNIDIALNEFPIAVEVFGGGWHHRGTHAARFRERFDYLINAGWIPVIVWECKRNWPIGDRAAEYIISLAERLRRGETVGRQEHVIRGDGKPSSVGKSNLEYRAVIGGDKSGDLVRGVDGRIRREAAGVSG